MAKVKYKVGDIVMIPVSDDMFAFGRLLQDASIAIYSFVSKGLVDVSRLESEEVLFDPGIFDTNIANGEWKIIGNIPFHDADDSWPTPKYIQDVINPDKYRLYYKGDIQPAKKQDIEGLERQVLYRPEELIKEIKNRIVIS